MLGFDFGYKEATNQGRDALTKILEVNAIPTLFERVADFHLPLKGDCQEDSHFGQI